MSECLNECIGLWLLKNSSSGSAHKFHRARMPYKGLFSTRLDIFYPQIGGYLLRKRLFQHPRLLATTDSFRGGNSCMLDDSSVPADGRLTVISNGARAVRQSNSNGHRI